MTTIKKLSINEEINHSILSPLLTLSVLFATHADRFPCEEKPGKCVCPVEEREREREREREKTTPVGSNDHRVAGFERVQSFLRRTERRSALSPWASSCRLEGVEMRTGRLKCGAVLRFVVLGCSREFSSFSFSQLSIPAVLS